jgi:hypothetical protein
MVSVKGSEIKEISERAGAREERSRSRAERDNEEGATRVLEALGEARPAGAPVDPAIAVFVPILENAHVFRPMLDCDSRLRLPVH